MLFIVMFWIIIGVILILFLINKKLKDQRLDSFIGFLVIMQFIIFIINIATKDPLFELIGLPKEYEWIGGLFLSGFILWIYYLNPLKNRVIEVEKKIERIDERTLKISKIDEDITWIINNCKLCKNQRK